MVQNKAGDGIAGVPKNNAGGGIAGVSKIKPAMASPAAPATMASPVPHRQATHRMMQPSDRKPLEKVHGHSLVIVRLIAIGKLLKALGLITVAIALHYMIAPDWHQRLIEYADIIRPDPHSHYLHLFLEKTLALSPATLKLLRVGLFVYAGLFLIEGVGLIFDKAWAEWMLVITTAGFIPLEVYEIVEHLSYPRVIIFALNVVILVYIALRIRWRHLAKIEARRRGAPLVTRDTTPSGIKP